MKILIENLIRKNATEEKSEVNRKRHLEKEPEATKGKRKGKRQMSEILTKLFVE
jgi:hypothetical protein